MKAKKIKVAEGRLLITWDDGSDDSIGLKYLRDECPCATCKGETILLRTYRPAKPRIEQENQYKIKSISVVGGYAVNITWQDGHDTGIYTWGYLKELARDEDSGKKHDYKPLI